MPPAAKVDWAALTVIVAEKREIPTVPNWAASDPPHPFLGCLFTTPRTTRISLAEHGLETDGRADASQ